MRFAITQIATGNLLPRNEDSTEAQSDDKAQKGSYSQIGIVTDLRELRAHFEALDTKGNGASPSFARDIEKKMETMQTSVEKVEKAVYSLIIRGKERPKGWIPSPTDDASAAIEPMEAY